MCYRYSLRLAYQFIDISNIFIIHSKNFNRFEKNKRSTLYWPILSHIFEKYNINREHPAKLQRVKRVRENTTQNFGFPVVFLWLWCMYYMCCPKCINIELVLQRIRVKPLLLLHTFSSCFLACCSTNKYIRATLLSKH